jgi:hypothetical protein
MEELPFSVGLIRFLAHSRTELVTKLFQFVTFVGEVEGYVLLVTLIYVVYDRGLAYRPAVLTLVIFVRMGLAERVPVEAEDRA